MSFLLFRRFFHEKKAVNFLEQWVKNVVIRLLKWSPFPLLKILKIQIIFSIIRKEDIPWAMLYFSKIFQQQT